MRHIALISDHASPFAPAGSSYGSLYSSPYGSGQDPYAAQLARHLAARGDRVDVYTRRDHPAQPPVVDWLPGVRVFQVPVGPTQEISGERLLRLTEDFAGYVRRTIGQRHLHYDLVHAHDCLSGMVALQLRAALGMPFVITFHALAQARRRYPQASDAQPDDGFAIEARLLRQADRVIAESEQDRNDLCQRHQTDSDRIEVVRCGFDPDEMWQVTVSARQYLGLDADEFIVLQLGRIVPREGIGNVIRAIALLQRRHAVAARLLIVGGNNALPDPILTPELGRLQALAQGLGIARAVTFTGQRPRSALRYYYSAANVLVSTPRCMPFEVAPIEAMACGTPVIGTTVGAASEAVIDRETGYLVPPDDPPTLADRLAWLALHPQTAQRFGWAGMRHAYRHFTWRESAARIAGIYEGLLTDAALTAVGGLSGGPNLSTCAHAYRGTTGRNDTRASPGAAAAAAAVAAVSAAAMAPARDARAVSDRNDRAGAAEPAASVSGPTVAVDANVLHAAR